MTMDRAATMSNRRGSLAVAVRNQVVAAIVVKGDELVYVARFSLRPTDHLRVAQRVHQLQLDYGAERVVLEDASTLTVALAECGLQPAVLTLAEAKLELLGDAEARHGVLYDRLVGDHPELVRFVRLLPGARRVATSDWRRTVVLLAAALGLTAERGRNNT